MSLAIIIMAAGKGTRMNSDLPKVLFEVKGKPLISYVLNLAEKMNADKTVVVVGHRKEQVIDVIYTYNVDYVIQEPQLGTGHAVMQAESVLEDFDGEIIVLSGDVPLIKKETLENMLLVHRENNSSGTVLTAVMDDPTGYGRIIRGEKGNVLGIVEQKDATEEQKQIKEFNSGIYVFNKKDLFEVLKFIKNENAQNEYYLTDALTILLSEGKNISAYVTNADEIRGVNTPEQLKAMEDSL